MDTKKQWLATAGLLFSLTIFDAQASLTPYTVNGVDLVRLQGSGFDVSFSKDGNLFKTMLSSNPNLVSQIAAVTPTYNDSYWGLRTIDANDFSINGQMTFWGAKAWVNYLNNIGYAGSNHWSLPDWQDLGQGFCGQSYSSGNCGYNVDTHSSALAQMYYNELGKLALYNNSGTFQNGFGIFSNNGVQIPGGLVGPFTNVLSDGYWLGSSLMERQSNAGVVFYHFDGSQRDALRYSRFFTWAVNTGPTSPVPLPTSWAMFASGVALLGVARRRMAGVHYSLKQ